MKGLFTVLVFLFLASFCSCKNVLPQPLTDDYFDALESDSFRGKTPLPVAAYSGKWFNVMDCGAVGDGKTDDSQAFIKAWGDLCDLDSAGVPTFYIPPGRRFMLGQVQFEGPCKAQSIHVQLKGSLVAPPGISWAGNGRDKWISFLYIDNLVIDGGGKIDGQGHFWWTACGRRRLNGQSNCKRLTALFFHKCNGLLVNGLTHLNSAKNHISICTSDNVFMSYLKIMAPETSPNTDGIDISSSTNVTIQNSYIATGDDCIAINGGTSYINITGVACGPGHGISIGSLGSDGAYDTVEEVNVENCNFKGADNGVRIKTWKGGRGYARKITFKNINLINTKNPIVINQFYYDKHRSQHLQAESHYQEIKISDVTYSNISGTSANDVAINLNCNQNGGGCTNIKIEGVDITPAVPGMQLHSVCSNAHGSFTSASPDVPCLFHT